MPSVAGKPPTFRFEILYLQKFAGRKIRWRYVVKSDKSGCEPLLMIDPIVIVPPDTGHIPQRNCPADQRAAFMLRGVRPLMLRRRRQFSTSGMASIRLQPEGDAVDLLVPGLGKATQV